jgi:hypothetical protein
MVLSVYEELLVSFSVNNLRWESPIQPPFHDDKNLHV